MSIDRKEYRAARRTLKLAKRRAKRASRQGQR